MINALKLVLFTWLSTSFVVTVPVVLTRAIQGYVEGLKKSDYEATGNAFIAIVFGSLVNYYYPKRDSSFAA